MATIGNVRGLEPRPSNQWVVTGLDTILPEPIAGSTNEININTLALSVFVPPTDAGNASSVTVGNSKSYALAGQIDTPNVVMEFYMDKNSIPTKFYRAWRNLEIRPGQSPQFSDVRNPQDMYKSDDVWVHDLLDGVEGKPLQSYQLIGASPVRSSGREFNQLENTFSTLTIEFAVDKVIEHDPENVPDSVYPVLPDRPGPTIFDNIAQIATGPTQALERAAGRVNRNIQDRLRGLL